MAMSKSSKPKTYKTSKKSIRRYNKRKAVKQARSNQDTKFLRVEAGYTLKPSQGLTTSNYLAWFPQLVDQTQSNPVACSSNPKFGVYAMMYDRVRVNKMTVTIIPKANVLDQGNAQLDADYNLTGDGLVHTCVDRNSCPPASIQAVQMYPSYKNYSNLKKFSRSYSITYPKGVWLDCKNGKIDVTDTTLLSKLGALGGIYFYAENFLEDQYEVLNEPWATAKVTWDCVFQGQAMNNIKATRDEKGNILSLSLEPYVTNFPPLAEPMPIYGTYDPKRVDLSGNEVVVDPDALP